MSAMERIYRIDQLLAGRKAVPRAELQEKLGVPWATLKRDLAYMKGGLHAPIVFDRDLGGYRFEREGQRIGPQYELPGLWFSAGEIHALLTRLSGLLGSADNPAEEVKKRIRIETVGARRFHLRHLRRHPRGRNPGKEGQGGLREAPRPGSRLGLRHLFRRQSHLGHAALHARAGEVGGGGKMASGSGGAGAGGRGYELKVPYTDDRELLMDVLKFGADCEVVEPTTLRERVLTECRKVPGTERAGASSLLHRGLDL